MTTRYSPLEAASRALSTVAVVARSQAMPGTATWLEILSERLGTRALDADEQVADGQPADAAEALALRELIAPQEPRDQCLTAPVVWSVGQVAMLLVLIVVAFYVGVLVGVG